MTSASMIPPLETLRPVDPRRPAELAEDIIAKPMTVPDFVDVPLANPTLIGRWMFTDRRRFSQATAQGWRVAKQADIKGGYLSPYSVEGGTKFINGDLILMLIDRKRYLGALRYKHEVAAALSDAAVQKRVSAQRAVSDMGAQVASVNQSRIQQGKEPVMSVFTPGAAEMPGAMSDPNVANKELSRLGGASRDIGTVADLTSDPHQ